MPCPYCYAPNHSLSMCIEGINIGVRFAMDNRRLIHLFQQDRARISTTQNATKTHYMMWLEQYLRQESAVRVRLIHYGLGGNLTGSKPENIQNITRLMNVIWDVAPPLEPVAFVRPLELSDHFMRYFQSPYRPHLQLLDRQLGINAENHIVEWYPQQQQQQEQQDDDSMPELIQEQAQPNYDRNWMDNIVDADPFVIFQNNMQPIERNLFRDFDVPALNLPNQPEPIRFCLSVEKWVHDDVCSICLTNEPFIQTHCNHVFCSCITTHMMQYQRTECPMCRQDITTLTVHDQRSYESLKSVECLFPQHVTFV